jgi:hypothetical protein
MLVIRKSLSATYIAAILIALVSLSAAAIADADADLLRVSTAFHQGLREGNATALAAVLDDRFTWTQADGVVQTKSDLLERLRLGKLRYAELRTEQEAVNQYGKAAVITGRSSLRHADEPKPLDLRYTLTLVKAGQHWKIGNWL